ncbi:Fc.00g033920.m01.CDS01 [Cosmosporella sp. VM-42]
MFDFIFRALLWATVLNSATASPSPLSPSAIQTTRRSRGGSELATWNGIRRALLTNVLNNRDQVSANTTSLNKSWENSVLFSYSEDQDIDTKKGNTSLSAEIEVTCTLCYITGTARTNFVYDGDLNVTETFDNFTNEIKNEVVDLADSVVEYIEDYFDGVKTKLRDGIDLDDFDLPTMPFDFNVDLPEIPEFGIDIQFDGLEVYMLIDTVLSAGVTYTLNLFTSETPVGFAVGNELEIGVIFSIDLILTVEGQIDISTGFHIRLEDGAAVNIVMFSERVSRVTLNGGEFEFLPVTVENAGCVFQAVLRLGVTAGFEVASPGLSIANVEVTEASAGVEVGVFANIANFITNVTVSPNGDDDNCTLRVIESYEMAIGAAAGASVALGDHTWGPVPETEIPIFYTTLTDACAIQGRGSLRSTASSAITSGAIGRRDTDDGDMVTTTVSREATYIAVACQSEGLINCPASLQTTSRITTTETLVTLAASGSEAAFPQSVRSSVTSTIAFGERSNKVLSSSGSPRSYNPPSPTSTEGDITPTNAHHDIHLGKTGGVPNRVILGVSIGLGVPVLLGIIGIIV